VAFIDEDNTATGAFTIGVASTSGGSIHYRGGGSSRCVDNDKFNNKMSAAIGMNV